MIAGGNWWRANEIVIRHLSPHTKLRYLGVTKPFRRLLAWLAALWRAFVTTILAAARDAPIPRATLPLEFIETHRRAKRGVLHGRLCSPGL
jgi:hypothetical protein